MFPLIDVYIEVQIIDSDQVIDTFYDDIPSIDGLVVGAIISEERLHSSGTKSHRKYKIISREETTKRETTQTKPDAVKPMLKIRIEEVPTNI